MTVPLPSSTPRSMQFAASHGLFSHWPWSGFSAAGHKGALVWLGTGAESRPAVREILNLTV